MTVCIVSFHQQTRPVPFTVRAIVTSSDIVFNMQDIDFGFCTVLESVRRTVTITNKSVLPQPFGFCGVPDVSNSLVLIYVQSGEMSPPRRTEPAVFILEVAKQHEYS